MIKAAFSGDAPPWVSDAIYHTTDFAVCQDLGKMGFQNLSSFSPSKYFILSSRLSTECWEKPSPVCSGHPVLTSVAPCISQFTNGSSKVSTDPHACDIAMWSWTVPTGGELGAGRIHLEKNVSGKNIFDNVFSMPKNRSRLIVTAAVHFYNFRSWWNNCVQTYSLWQKHLINNQVVQ